MDINNNRHRYSFLVANLLLMSAFQHCSGGSKDICHWKNMSLVTKDWGYSCVNSQPPVSLEQAIDAALKDKKWYMWCLEFHRKCSPSPVAGTSPVFTPCGPSTSALLAALTLPWGPTQRSKMRNEQMTDNMGIWIKNKMKMLYISYLSQPVCLNSFLCLQ